MIERKKNTRARAPEKKKKQLDNILEVGKDLFIRYGAQGFSLRQLADKLNMAKSNLYNYVESKRELWFAIRSRYFFEYEKGFADILKTHDSDYVDLGVKWAQYFLDFAAADRKRFEMMFFIRAPSSNKTGAYEKKYRPLDPIIKGINITLRAVEEGKNKEKDPVGLYYYMYATCLGAAKVEADLKLTYKILDPSMIEKTVLSNKHFRDFFLKEFRTRLEKAYIT
ncbi:MAG: TetR/AcrR family transcriptional regulator [Candidatus Lokiarchaeota archaeon]|nr:TetR/AcrR family transcriptional regulator [Candidatus Lokiarchaeota archaeon]